MDGTAIAGQAAAGSPSAAVTNTAPPSNSTGGVTPPSDWTTGFDDGRKGFVQNKGWKAPAEAIDSYMNLEKLMGGPSEQLVRLPKTDDIPGWESVYTRLGKPATPEAYKLDVPKDATTGATKPGDTEFAKWAEKAFHKAHLSSDQAKEVYRELNEFGTQRTTAKQASIAAQAIADTATLKQEWGAAYETNVNVAKRAAREFGVSGDVIDAMEKSVGSLATMKFFKDIGARIGDAGFVGGNGRTNPMDGSGPMEPAQAKAAITALRGDSDFVNKYAAGDAKSRQQLENLHRYAYPDPT